MKLIVNNKEVVITDRSNVSKKEIYGLFKNIWFDMTIDGVEYSLIDCGALMRNSQIPPPEGIFMGWETLRENETERGESLEELLDKLTTPSPKP